ncbi:MAG: excinuclease ABC subunit UvrA [Candidatus Kapabacteria bacterium]|nr:excinuclease ABC subunit UvrA [Candidatus Kapabacteria bacterium]
MTEELYAELDDTALAGEFTHVIVRGAKEHNLKNVSVDIPREQLVVMTGLSGSGKSSLAFDTIYAEGQRRYVESLSPYARQFLGMMEKPEVDAIDGLSPAISIEQKTVGSNPRSTVGTVTEVYDYVRLLYSKIGVQYCVDHPDMPVKKQSFDQIVENILALGDGTKIYILAPIVRGRKGHYREQFEQLRKQGFTRVRVDGRLQEITDGMQLQRYQIHTIEVVIDRIAIAPDQEQRLRESCTLAMKMGEGVLTVLTEETAPAEEGKTGVIGLPVRRELFYSESNACPKCQRSYELPAPNAFSFNSPFGACPACQGLGEIRDFNTDLFITDKSITLEDGGIAPLGKQRDTWLWRQVEAVCKEYSIKLSTPVGKLTSEQIKLLMYGAGTELFAVNYTFSSGRTTTYRQRFSGIVANLQDQYDKTSSTAIRATIEQYMSSVPCHTCGGGRLKPESLNVRIGGKTIAEVGEMAVSEALMHFRGLHLTEREETIARLILREITSRLAFLEEVGLQYLTLSRAARTLSGGEGQRIRLASQIGSQLTGVMYVLDEPSIGLHQHDNRKLIGSLKRLRDLGNTVIVVEHDREMIEEADYVIDLGPRAGVHGGEMMFAGTAAELKKQEGSLTADYLAGRRIIPSDRPRREGSGKELVLENATGNNLQDVTLRIPLETFTCITGMSGSGKSSLVNDTLYPILSRHFYDSLVAPLQYGGIKGLEHIDKVIEIDQSPIGRTPRSNPATYTGLFTLVRDLFAQLPEANIRGYKPGRFSFNVDATRGGGRCEACEGDGVKKIEMNFLPDVYVPCDVCNGKRYNAETLQVKYKGKSIADVLEMTVDEAVEFFRDIPKIARQINTLQEVGLGYIHLGQQATTLSGGEAQRVKLATELAKISTGKTLYILDEPTTGLHFEDVNILLELLHKLVEKKNTVVVIEHNLDVIKTADWLIDLGPEGGKHGGRIIAEGTPENVAKDRTVTGSFTGRYLQEELDRDAALLKANGTSILQRAYSPKTAFSLAEEPEQASNADKTSTTKTTKKTTTKAATKTATKTAIKATKSQATKPQTTKSQATKPKVTKPKVTKPKETKPKTKASKK